jgi:cell wall-associated NlpC family hydrolase
LPAVHAAPGLVSVTAFDRLVVDQLGLADVAAHVQRATAAVGLRPPAYYGTEVVARYLGLRYNHPTGTDQLELFPSDPITRAEAAWSLAQAMDDGSWSIQSARQALMTYALPQMSPDQLTALRIAVSRIGYPYVYAGTTDDTSDGLAHGGFDCSGFVWRVFKVSGLPWGQRIGGRTAAQMAQEIPHRDRLDYDQLRPGDLLFFGSAHFNSTATEANVIHTGIYLGDNWVIHSSGQGVYVLPLHGSWLGDQFAWGRRVLP